jgi:hypothetical protein
LVVGKANQFCTKESYRWRQGLPPPLPALPLYGMVYMWPFRTPFRGPIQGIVEPSSWVYMTSPLLKIPHAHFVKSSTCLTLPIGVAQIPHKHLTRHFGMYARAGKSLGGVIFLGPLFWGWGRCFILNRSMDLRTVKPSSGPLKGVLKGASLVEWGPWPTPLHGALLLSSKYSPWWWSRALPYK